jgi:hypothetical protein
MVIRKFTSLSDPNRVTSTEGEGEEGEREGGERREE